MAVLTALVVASGPAAAKGAPEVVEFSESFEDVNPCTGELVMIFADFILFVHSFEVTGPGRHHFNIQFFVDFSTSDGFAGSGVGPDVDNGAGLFGEEEGRGTFTSIFNGKLRSPDTRGMISIHFNLHVTAIGGEVVAFVDNFSITCVG